MRNLAHTMVLVLLAIGLTGAAAVAYSIPAEQRDPQKIFWGEPSSFEKPGEVDYQEVIKSTPEYRQITDKKIGKGTGKYWILLSKASDRAVQAISGFGEDAEFDLIAARGYLESLTPAIPAENITKLIIKSMDSEEKKGKDKSE